MQKYLTIILTIITITSSLKKLEGADTNTVSAFSGTIGLRALDHYLSYRTGGSATKTPVIWPEMEIRHRSGLYLSLFGSYSVSPHYPSGNQFDVDVGYRFPIAYGLKADVNIRYSNMNPTDDWEKGDIIYPNLILQRDMIVTRDHTLKCVFYNEWIGKFAEDYSRGTLLSQFGIVHTWKNPFGLSSKLSFSTANFFSYCDKYGKLDEGFFFRSDVGLIWKWWKMEFTLPGCRLVAPFGDTGRQFDKSLFSQVKMTW